MEVQRHYVPEMGKPLAAYCHVARKGSMVFTAGMVALDGEGQIVGKGDIAAQTRHVLETLKTALATAGASLKDVVKTTIFLSDFDDYKGMNAVYSEYFGDDPPARACVRADIVLPELLVEIEAVAIAD